MRSGRWRLEDVLGTLPPETPGARYVEPASNGTMRLGLYAPRDHDPQRPHDQDELYIVQSGTGILRCDGGKQPFGPGDVLFVGAGVEHRFEDFSDDFAAWVVFWGPTGGEGSE
tara:strand:- start:345 stop:683 length:339 start_codon:yes stop_codon:yes gene_type:complete